MQKRAFTLIELLVVIAIIAILAAILFPVFAQARAKARQAACLSNMKQIGIGIMQYTQDYDELVPPSQVNNAAGGTTSWPTMLYSYVKNEDVFVCPSSSEDPRKADPKFVVSTSTRLYSNVTIDSATSNQGGDGTDPLSQSLVSRLSYSRNLIPAFNGDAWTKLNSGAPINNGQRTFPNFASDLTGNPKYGWAGAPVSVNAAGVITSGGGTTTPVALPDVVDPAGTIHIVDGMVGTIVANNNYGASMRGLQQDIRTDMFNDGPPSKVDGRHNGGYVAVYGDGHAGWRPWGKSLPCEWTVQDDNCR